MARVKLAVIYYSTYGTNHRIAEIAEEAGKAAGAEVRLRRVRETAPKEVVEGQEKWKAQAEKTAHITEASNDDLEWADAYLFSAPTRYGVAASQMRAFFDQTGPLWAKGALADKAVSAISSAQNMHGGQEATLLSTYVTMMHWGAIIVAPGYTDEVQYKAGGNPYGVSVTATGKGVDEAHEAAIRYQVKRLGEIAAKLTR